MSTHSSHDKMFLAVSSLVIALTLASTASAVPVWGQCGGNGYSGPTNCDSGSTCVKLNDWYSQCQPGGNPTPTTTTTPTSSPTTAPTTSPTGTTTTGGGDPPLPTDCPNTPSQSSYNYQYLTDPFTFADGSKVTTKAQWACRSEEILKFAQEYELGDFPTTAQTSASLSGNTLSITASDNGRSAQFSVSISYPSGGSAPYPAIIAYGFASIPIPAGVATITFNNDDIAAQQQGVRGRGKFFDIYGSGHSAGATTAWAWGVGRIIDALEQVDARIDPTRVGVTGCSRNGKGAFMAGVFEKRVALTLPQESGSGGTNTWRISDWMRTQGIDTQTASQIVGENVWFSPRFDQYASSSVNKMPFDHHLLVGSVAPRGLFAIDQAAIDWLGSQSSFGSLMGGREVYKAMGVPTNLGFSQSSGHDHCSFPGSQTSDLNKFINRFLLNQNVDTDVTYTAGNYNSNWPGQWTPWTTPNLS